MAASLLQLVAQTFAAEEAAEKEQVELAMKASTVEEEQQGVRHEQQKMLDAWLLTKGLVREDVPADGHCQYTAWVRAARFAGIKTKGRVVLRSMVADFVLDNAARFQEALCVNV